MILDHINGINNDNRIENLRMICPNCNSQQKTFAGRNNRGKKKCEAKVCVDCGVPVTHYSLRCKKCSALKKRKTTRPEISILKKDVDKLGWEATGRKYGVSGNAVRKWYYKTN
jgi:hypothetical protein